MRDLTKQPEKQWDPVVKLTHWGIALAILGNGAITEGGSWPHIVIGYTVAAMLGLRLLWGLVGPSEARFSAFPPSLAKAAAHLRELKISKADTHASHNPLGALMVYAIWSVLGIIVATGIVLAGVPPKPVVHEHGRAEQQVAATEPDDDGDRDGENPLGEVHETAVNVLYGLILLHLGGVMFESRRSGRGLVMAMLPRRR